MEKIDISKNSDFFHDGGIIFIKNYDNSIEVAMESAIIEKNEVDEDISLSIDNRIKGILHIEQVKEIKTNHLLVNEISIPLGSDGEILDFKITTNSVTFLIIWRQFSSQNRQSHTNFIEILAQKIWWENIPNLNS